MAAGLVEDRVADDCVEGSLVVADLAVVIFVEALLKECLAGPALRDCKLVKMVGIASGRFLGYLGCLSCLECLGWLKPLLPREYTLATCSRHNVRLAASPTPVFLFRPAQSDFPLHVHFPRPRYPLPQKPVFHLGSRRPPGILPAYLGAVNPAKIETLSPHL